MSDFSKNIHLNSSNSDVESCSAQSEFSFLTNDLTSTSGNSSSSSSFLGDSESNLTTKNKSNRLKWIFTIIIVIIGLIFIFGIFGWYFVKKEASEPIKYQTCKPDSEIPLHFTIKDNFKNISEHLNYDVIEKQDCGDENNSQVAMFSNSTFFCTAVMAQSRRFLIAPSHCVQDSNFTLKFGCRNAACSNDDSITLENDDFWVDTPWVYNDNTKMHDIAFIELKKSIEREDLAPACLPLNNEENSNDIFLSTFLNEDSKYLNFPLKVNMTLASNEECIKIYTHRDTDCTNTAPITDYHLCAGVKQADGRYKGTVNGQSGSPLYARFDSKIKLIGFVSWGSYQKEELKPSVFVSIKPYLKTILDHLQAEN